MVIGIRKLSEAEKADGILPVLGHTPESRLLREIAVKEKEMKLTKIPFCRPCVWADFEQERKRANLEAGISGRKTPIIFPNLNDPKYTEEFELIGEKKVQRDALVDGMKQRMNVGVLRTYRCTRRGHHIKIEHSTNELELGPKIIKDEVKESKKEK